jgi:hypothetical protein
MSKGSTRRPTQISEKELAKRWEEAFGKKQAPGFAEHVNANLRNTFRNSQQLQKHKGTD